MSSVAAAKGCATSEIGTEDTEDTEESQIQRRPSVVRLIDGIQDLGTLRQAPPKLFRSMSSDFTFVSLLTGVLVVVSLFVSQYFWGDPMVRFFPPYLRYF